MNLPSQLNTVDSTLESFIGNGGDGGAALSAANIGFVLVVTSLLLSPLVGIPLTAFLFAMAKYRGWN